MKFPGASWWCGRPTVRKEMWGDGMDALRHCSRQVLSVTEVVNGFTEVCRQRPVSIIGHEREVALPLGARH